jgi:hypothetical protein
MICDSFECNNKWSAAIRMTHILEEIKLKYRNIQLCGYYCYIQNIKEKYKLPNDIPIFDYIHM